MAGSGVNFAITKDGGAYNKLSRPEYLVSASVPPPPKKQKLSSDFLPMGANKRKQEQEQEQERQGTEDKRTKLETYVSEKNVQHGLNNATAHPMRDLECGMRTVLPGLNNEGDDSEESVADALAYLRSVRSEASTIPHLLTAQMLSPDHDDEELNKDNVLYDDGTWVAVDEISYACSDVDSEHVADFNAQDRFYDLLIQRFDDVRTTLAHLDISPEVTKHKKPQDGKRAWYDTMEQEYPLPRHIKSLDQHSLFWGLEACTHTVSDLSSNTIPPQLSCWIWSLLASIGDAGTLDHERVSIIRDLGLETGLFGARIREAKGRDAHGQTAGADEGEISNASQHDQARCTSPAPGYMSESDAEMSLSGDESSALHATNDFELQEARARLLAQLGDRLVQNSEKMASHDEGLAKHGLSNGSSLNNGALHGDGTTFIYEGSTLTSSIDGNTRLTIDMVLTVVAECFGQKDLLRYRQLW